MRATRAVIRLDSLAANVRAVKERVGEKRLVLFPVKADGYGHGAVEVSRAALAAGCTHLAVASADEGLSLREAGIEAPVLILSLALPEEYSRLARANVEPLLSDAESVAEFARAARAEGRKPRVHLKVDTGMGRIGCRPAEALAIAAAIARERCLELGGFFTHFPSADSSDPGDEAYTARQTALFLETIEIARRAGVAPAFASAANSGGVMRHPDSWFDMVRPGIILYGYPPCPSGKALRVSPVMELVSKIVFMKRVEAGEYVSYGRTWRAEKPTVIGTLPVGYADGYPRSLSNRSSVLIGQRARPVVGRVCMDQLMVDLGPEPEAGLYDDAYLFGPRELSPTAADLAALAGTIPYEITCGINKRVPRVYVGRPS